jgi:hypothetical protein
MIYRRRLRSDVWHFMETCRWWPTVDGYHERDRRPRSGELCDECLAKTRRR